MGVWFEMEANSGIRQNLDEKGRSWCSINDHILGGVEGDDGRCSQPLPDWPVSLTLTTLEHQNPRTPPDFLSLFLSSRLIPTTHLVSWNTNTINIVHQHHQTVGIVLLFSLSGPHPTSGFHLVLVHPLPHQWTLLPSTMSPTTTTTRHQVAMRHSSTESTKSTKKEKHPRKVMLHRPMSPPPPEDWVLFPQEVVAQKFSNVRHAKPRSGNRSASARPQNLPLPNSHVIESRAATPTRSDSSHTPEPYRPSYCLHHMSARNCTPACHDVRLLPETQKLPKAPSPPRLPTPDLPDLEEDDLWSCCRSVDSNASECYTRDDNDFWNEMSMNIFLAPERSID